jgi:hypothetical protein
MIVLLVVCTSLISVGSASLCWERQAAVCLSCPPSIFGLIALFALHLHSICTPFALNLLSLWTLFALSLHPVCILFATYSPLLTRISTYISTSLPHSLTPSLPHSLTPSLPHSLTPSLTIDTHHSHHKYTTTHNYTLILTTSTHPPLHFTPLHSSGRRVARSAPPLYDQVRPTERTGAGRCAGACA